MSRGLGDVYKRQSIPMSEVNVVQQKFEDNVKAALNVGENPFELIYEGELDKQR